MAKSWCHLDATHVLKSHHLAARALILALGERIHGRTRLRRASLASRATFPPFLAPPPAREEAPKAHEVLDKLRRVKQEAALGRP